MSDLSSLIAHRLSIHSDIRPQHPIHKKTMGHEDLIQNVKHYFCQYMKVVNEKTPSSDDAPVLHHWGYEQKGGDWGVVGTEQSPIDIKLSEARPSVTHYLKILWTAEPVITEVCDNGHTLMVSGTVSKLVGSDATRSNHLYESVQFHFHTPSEHTVDGKYYPLELHFVHAITAEHYAISESQDAEDLAPARHLAVLGIFFEIDDDAPPHPFLEALKLDTIGVPIELNMNQYFPELDRPEYFSYPGSLTTPPCSEIVNWFVVKKPVKMTSAQLKPFMDRSEFSQFGNNRLCQPVGRRHVCTGNCDFVLDFNVEAK